MEWNSGEWNSRTEHWQARCWPGRDWPARRWAWRREAEAGLIRRVPVRRALFGECSTGRNWRLERAQEQLPAQASLASEEQSCGFALGRLPKTGPISASLDVSMRLFADRRRGDFAGASKSLPSYQPPPHPPPPLTHSILVTSFIPWELGLEVSAN